MLEWTGERYLPWIKDAAIAYEHLHRYSYAADIAKGKAVLDLACGEGYGSNLLAASAAAVVAVDIDENAVAHARSKYKRPNLEFLSGSITQLPIREDHAFDLVVCFEAIEHIEDQEKLISEVGRALKPGGLFIVSTPNKEVYDEESTEENMFHVKELDFAEFRDLLQRHFRNIEFLGQRLHVHSNMWPLNSSRTSLVVEKAIARRESEFEFIDNSSKVPLYFVAIASNAPLEDLATGSILVDHSDQYLKEKEREILDLRTSRISNEKALSWQEALLEEQRQTLKSREDAILWHATQLAGKDGEITALDEGMDWMKQRIAGLEEGIGRLEEGIGWKDDRIHVLESAIQSQEEALAWKDTRILGFESAIQSQKEALAWKDTRILGLESAIQSKEEALVWKDDQIHALESAVKSQEEGLAWQSGVIEDLEKSAKNREEFVKTLEAERNRLSNVLDAVSRQLGLMEQSRGWKLIVRLRRLRDKFRKPSRG